MKVEVKEKEVKYPCLMINEDMNIIVLFTSRDCGVSVNHPDDYLKYSEHWDTDVFKPFNGTVTLSND